MHTFKFIYIHIHICICIYIPFPAKLPSPVKAANFEEALISPFSERFLYVAIPNNNDQIIENERAKEKML
jgi:hypothetical protein